jgi:hypothetical protein
MNVAFLLLNFMAFIAVCVGFGGVLMTAKVADDSKVDFYWSHAKSDSSTANFGNSDECSTSGTPCADFNHGGKGFLAMMVFAFLCILPCLLLSLVRVAGIHISFLEPTRKVLFLELLLTSLTTFWFFLALCIYGGAVFHKAKNYEVYHDVQMTGFGYILACFFFLLVSIALIFSIRADSSTHLGSASGSDYSNDEATTNYNPPASYQYNGQGHSATLTPLSLLARVAHACHCYIEPAGCARWFAARSIEKSDSR